MKQIYRRTPIPKWNFDKLLCNFIQITLRHGCSPVNLLHIIRTPFPNNTSGGLLLFLWMWFYNPSRSAACVYKCQQRLYSFKSPRIKLKFIKFLVKKYRWVNNFWFLITCKNQYHVSNVNHIFSSNCSFSNRL